MEGGQLLQEMHRSLFFHVTYHSRLVGSSLCFLGQELWSGLERKLLLKVRRNFQGIKNPALPGDWHVEGVTLDWWVESKVFAKLSNSAHSLPGSLLTQEQRGYWIVELCHSHGHPRPHEDNVTLENTVFERGSEATFRRVQGLLDLTTNSAYSPNSRALKLSTLQRRVEHTTNKRSVLEYLVWDTRELQFLDDSTRRVGLQNHSGSCHLEIRLARQGTCQTR